MPDASLQSQPRLIVVTGRPASGKTTLARSLSRAIWYPLISRDELKEGLINTPGANAASEDIALAVYRTFFDTIDLLLSRRISLVAEAAFQHKLWAARLEPLRQTADVRIICCTLPAEIARARHEQRRQADAERERFHPDPQRWSEADYDPPRLPGVPMLQVNTAGATYQPPIDSILLFARD